MHLIDAHARTYVHSCTTEPSSLVNNHASVPKCVHVNPNVNLLEKCACVQVQVPMLSKLSAAAQEDIFLTVHVWTNI